MPCCVACLGINRTFFWKQINHAGFPLPEFRVAWILCDDSCRLVLCGDSWLFPPETGEGRTEGCDFQQEAHYSRSVGTRPQQQPGRAAPALRTLVKGSKHSKKADTVVVFPHSLSKRFSTGKRSCFDAETSTCNESRVGFQPQTPDS